MHFLFDLYHQFWVILSIFSFIFFIIWSLSSHLFPSILSISDLFNQIISQYYLYRFWNSDIFHHISCHKSYLSDHFHQIISQYYIYHFWKSDLFHHISCHQSYLFDIFLQILSQSYLYQFGNLIYFIVFLVINHIYMISFIILFLKHIYIPIMLCYIFIICYFFSFVFSFPLYPVYFYFPQMSNYLLCNFLFHLYFHIFCMVQLLYVVIRRWGYLCFIYFFKLCHL